MHLKPLQEQDSSALINLTRSLLLGLPLAGALLGYVAMKARDGRMPVTDWMDPMLAGLTLFSMLMVELVVIVLWQRLGEGLGKRWIARGLIISQWAYTLGEIVSNTITIGEPPEDIGSLFEIAAGSLFVFLVIGLVVIFYRQTHMKPARGGFRLLVLATIAFVGMGWWFAHPIDQSKPGAPDYIEGNGVYNWFHRYLK